MVATAYGAGWAATARTGVDLVVRSLSAETPALSNIQAESDCPFLVSASFDCDWRGDGTSVAQGSVCFVWFPGFGPREISRDGPFIYCNF